MFADADLALMEFKDKSSLFSTSLETTTREKVYTIDELRAIDGKQPLPNNEGNKLLTATPAPANPSQFSATGKILQESDFELIKDIGTPREHYDFVTDEALKFADDKIDKYLISEDINGKTIKDIIADIQNKLGEKVSADDLKSRLNKLSEAKLISSDIVDGKVNIKPIDEPKIGREVQVMYEYKVRPEYGPEPLIATSRGFCIKLINNDRLYSLFDLKTIDSIFGFSTLKHGGGWLTDPNTGEAVSHCRHEWKTVKVVRKDSGK